LNKAPDAFRTISEVADELDLPQHVLRFWESRFPHIRPMKRGGGRRYYRPEDIDLLRGIRHLLYGDGYTIRGVQRILREQGVRTVQSVGQGQAISLPPQGDEYDGVEPGGVDERNGTAVPRNVILAGDSIVSDNTKLDGFEEEEQPDDPGPPGLTPQNRPMAEANGVSVPLAPRAEGVQVRRAPIPVTAPSSRGMTAGDLGRLKHALAELEACRRLLDKANDGGQ
jgi:DNA-binding transcriptional MerR regulator